MTDASGAVIPAATVVLSNAATGVRYTVKTDSVGSYRMANVPPGPGYVLEVTADGFTSARVDNVYINVANAGTQNVQLNAGTTQQVVVKSSNAVTLNTTDATIGNNFQVSKLQDLPVQDRTSPSVLFTLQPGITQSGATTGARTDQNNTSIDGLDVNNFTNGNFAVGASLTSQPNIIGDAPVDSIQEFRGTTAGFTAGSGPGGGGQFQLVTKGGTNEWHGNINEYHRDNSTTANDWFNANAGVAQPKLVRNQFGGSVGGPIQHDKLFFFFDYLGSRIAQDETVERAVPLSTFQQGTIQYINNNPGCTGASRINTTPDCISQLSPVQVQQIDPAHIGQSSQIASLLHSRYPGANDPAFGDGVNSAGFRFNSAIPTDLTNYVGRIDWVFSPTIKFYGIGNVARENQVTGTSQFPGDPASSQFIDRSYRYALGMDWQISETKFNRLTFGSAVQDFTTQVAQNVLGANQISFFNGFTNQLFDNPYNNPAGSSYNHTPISQVNDSFTWIVGRHQIEMGGYFKWIHSTNTAQNGFNTYSIGLGGHLFGVPQLEPGNLLNTSDAASEGYDNALLTSVGRIASLGSTFNYTPQGTVDAQPSSAFREYAYYQTQPYISDVWKVTEHLTINAGLNYQYFTVPYEEHGLETVQTIGFDQYFDARMAQSAAGRSGNDTVPFITYVLGGKKNNGPSYYAANRLNFAPRLGFAYSPAFDPATVFNGSVGIVYDRTVTNAIQAQQTTFSYLFQQGISTPYGNNGDPSGSVQNDPRLSSPPAVVIPTAPKAPYQPWVTDGVPQGLQLGNFNSMIDPHLKTPYSILFNFGMQHQFPGSMVLKMSYVGRLGRRLLAQADASQLIDFPDVASGQTMNQAMQHIEQEVRSGMKSANLPAEPWFEHQVSSTFKGTYPNLTSAVADSNRSLVQVGDFGDFIQALSPNLQANVGMAAQFGENAVFTNKGFSSYNAMLVSLQKNLSHGLQFDVNYTFAHSIDNVSLVANTNANTGYGFVCDATHPRECRGNSDFDVTHYVSSDFTYALPFGHGRTFGGKLPLAINEVVGGWNVSGIPYWHSGQAWTPLSNAFVAGFANDAPAIFNGDYHAVRRHVHKQTNGSLTLFADPAAAAAAFSGPQGLTIGSRNILRATTYFNLDAGLFKDFALVPSQRVKLQFRADAFNVLNHPNFDQLDYGSYASYTTITAPSNFGQLTAMNGSPRVLQLSGRIQF